MIKPFLSIQNGFNLSLSALTSKVIISLGENSYISALDYIGYAIVNNKQNDERPHKPFNALNRANLKIIQLILDVLNMRSKLT